jgi:transcriptional regulator with XRE-family HTH domain
MEMTLFKQVDPRKLREARVAAGLTQADIAERLDVTKAQVGNIETGFSAIRVDDLPIWALACGVEDLDTLYTDAPRNAFSTRKRNSR